ncbi:sperm flagellar protein 1-like [Selaginella moellendorffii]|uniref:sperm flagellar protein 1-like n=1 Tax=Selaginella moellendorffii TaxID=88036 RepID=UPI000D1CDCE1|nr:sperm flagellar protein 1-like [Selaginella moellendorffii]|eukprot:XP_024516316.1 sperm flagellar protein 1-like [Selaginella moellendorffii]
MDVAPEELPGLYSWVDGIPLSRPKRNIARDFSDGVLAAEVVAHYCPRLVDIHNYSAANSLAQKIYNWNTLNNKVFRRLNFSLTKEDVEAVANAENQMIERILKLLKYKIAKYRPIKTESMKHEPNGHVVQSPKRTDSPERQERDGMNESQKDIQLRELRETIEVTKIVQ